MKINLKLYRAIGVQLGASFGLPISVSLAIVPSLILTTVIAKFVVGYPIILIGIALVLTVGITYFVTLPLWGVIELAQARKSYGDGQVSEFIKWLESDEKIHFEFK
ncbi:hypothetical protein DDO73_19195 [Vibrio cholerae]|nr:hypothetical protein [Vibrio cholerae]EGR4075173.1 hypothetical protein [Vibrio cholerae]